MVPYTNYQGTVACRHTMVFSDVWEYENDKPRFHLSVGCTYRLWISKSHIYVNIHINIYDGQHIQWALCITYMYVYAYPIVHIISLHIWTHYMRHCSCTYIDIAYMRTYIITYMYLICACMLHTCAIYDCCVWEQLS